MKVWEPWTPEVGQTVMMRRPSGECVCPECGEPAHSSLDRVDWPAKAIVIAIDRVPPSQCGHFQPSHRIAIRSSVYGVGCAAVIELEPVEDPV
ncbi:hypothetical protein LCGC14_2611790 [marine sediment metagenome]|uniref:Uncharacterized protein n=1 Tax=marine sediment metagenome TaxID=412755 RepID=A0A0F9A5W9_9ZZZZ